jgi:transcriptional regulator with XRE-family HTH domain
MSIKNRVFVNAHQIRAARAYLNWSQEDLAAAAELSIATIRQIETGHISPRDKTMEAIISALEQSKIEFTPSGVRQRGDDVTILEGDDCYMQLLDDIYHTTKGKGGEVLFIYADSSLSTEEEILSLNRTRKDGVKWRFLTVEGNNCLTYPIEEYRWLPKKFFKRNIQVIYGGRVAMGCTIDKSRNQTTKMIIVDSAPLAESTRNLFEFIWESCRKPSFSTAPKVYE